MQLMICFRTQLDNKISDREYVLNALGVTEGANQDIPTTKTYPPKKSKCTQKSQDVPK